MPTPTTFAELVLFVINFINILIPTLFGVLFVYVMWKIVDAWVIHAGDEKKRTEGRRLVTVAILVFVLMVSTWGIIAFIKSSIFG
jgi:hypothetical protein